MSQIKRCRAAAQVAERDTLRAFGTVWDPTRYLGVPNLNPPPTEIKNTYNKYENFNIMIPPPQPFAIFTNSAYDVLFTNPYIQAPRASNHNSLFKLMPLPQHTCKSHPNPNPNINHHTTYGYHQAQASPIINTHINPKATKTPNQMHTTQMILHPNNHKQLHQTLPYIQYP